MEKIKIILFGAGDQAIVVNSIIKELDYTLHSVFDEKVKYFQGQTPISNFEEGHENVVIAIGENKIRKKISALKNNYLTIKHPSVIIDSSVKLGNGSMLIQGAIIQVNAIIGDHVIINTNATIDHDCIIGDFVHVAPSATLCGHVSVGDGTLIGAGVTILPGVKVGKWCTIGAGAVVTKSIPDYSVYFGNPAILKGKNEK